MIKFKVAMFYTRFVRPLKVIYNSEIGHKMHSIPSYLAGGTLELLKPPTAPRISCNNLVRSFFNTAFNRPERYAALVLISVSLSVSEQELSELYRQTSS